MKLITVVLMAAILSACGGGNATDEEIAEHAEATGTATIQPVNCDIPGNCK